MKNLRHILILLFILGLLAYSSNVEAFSPMKPKIAIYSYNFGNFRDELGKGIDNIITYSDFDYYFYTDQDVKSEKWNGVKSVGISVAGKYRLRK